MKELIQLIFEVVRDWLYYKHRGFVQPDHLDQENYPLINGPGDACAQKIIDQGSKKPPY